MLSLSSDIPPLPLYEREKLSVSKPLAIAGSGSCRLKSAAAWGTKRKAVQGTAR